jgi:hypothetical protein
LTPLDPDRDTPAQGQQKCAQVRTENLTENSGMAQAFQQSVP